MNFDNVFELLTKHKLDIDLPNRDDLKCSKCKQILINACQFLCGCRICRMCINQMLNEGKRTCAGNTEDCKESYISIFKTDFGKNEEISKLIVKCPERNCRHQCELFLMDEHLRVCPDKNIHCPFNRLGCSQKLWKMNDLNNHVQSEEYNHFVLLTDTIQKLRADIDELKKRGKDSETEIEIIKQNSFEKDEKIEDMSRKITLIEIENEELSQIVDIVKNTLGETGHTLNVDSDSRPSDQKIKVMKERINSLKIEKLDKITALARLKPNLEDKNDVNVNQKPNENDCQEERRKTLENTIKLRNKERDCEKPFEWEVDNIIIKGKKCGWKGSEFFYSKRQKYKLQLGFMTYNDQKHFCIYLYIHGNENGPTDKWPFNEDVTIKVCHRLRPDSWKRITRSCSIDQPSVNSCNCSDAFLFSYSDLSVDSLTQDDGFIIRCVIREHN